MACRKDSNNCRGSYLYVPKNILDKVMVIKKKKRFKRNVDAWNELNVLSDVGMNVDDFYSAFFGKRGR